MAGIRIRLHLVARPGAGVADVPGRVGGDVDWVARARPGWLVRRADWLGPGRLAPPAANGRWSWCAGDAVALVGAAGGGRGRLRRLVRPAGGRRAGAHGGVG